MSKLEGKGWATFGTFAFAIPGEPGRIPDAEFKAAVSDPIIGTEVQHMAKPRRLHFGKFRCADVGGSAGLLRGVAPVYLAQPRRELHQR